MKKKKQTQFDDKKKMDKSQEIIKQKPMLVSRLSWKTSNSKPQVGIWSWQEAVNVILQLPTECG